MEAIPVNVSGPPLEPVQEAPAWILVNRNANDASGASVEHPGLPTAEKISPDPVWLHLLAGLGSVASDSSCVAEPAEPELPPQENHLRT